MTWCYEENGYVGVRAGACRCVAHDSPPCIRCHSQPGWRGHTVEVADRHRRRYDRYDPSTENPRTTMAIDQATKIL